MSMEKDFAALTGEHNMDLTNKLTVFLITAGKNPNYTKTYMALKKQTCTFKLEIIKDYFPLSKAFQEMINRCNTEFYIEIDDDMVMNDNAIERLYDTIVYQRTLDINKVLVSYMLKDVHLDMDIFGVKIYHAETFKKYPYDLSHPSCEVEQLERMKLDGYTYSMEPEVIGKHSPKWTNELIFERYRNLFEKFKIYGYNWIKKLPRQLLLKAMSNPSEINMYAFAGILSGIYNDSNMKEEKDIRTRSKDFSKTELYMQNVPNQATIYMTNKCNFKCEWCVTGDTLILKDDFTSVPISTVKKGDSVIGFKEKNLILPTEINHVFKRKKQVYKITTNKGIIETTDEHPFMNHEGKWITVKDLINGKKKIGSYRSNIRFIGKFKEFTENENFKAGYLSGIIQGDGTIGKNISKEMRRFNLYNETCWVTLRMTDKEPIDRYCKYLEHFNINYKRRIIEQKYENNRTCKFLQVFVTNKNGFSKLRKLIKTNNSNDWYIGFLSGMFDAEGGYTNIIRISSYNKVLNKHLIKLGETLGFEFKEESQGVRLIGGIEKEIEFLNITNPSITRKKENIYKKTKRLTNAKIEKIEKLGLKTVYNLETNCHTFWANGFASHNCLRQSEEIEQAPDADARLVNSLLQKLPTINAICICGYGEPFSSPKLPEVIKAIKSKNKVCGLITNGSLLVEKYNDYILNQKYKPNYISVSLNAGNKEDHKQVTNTDTWDTVIEGIKLASKTISLYLSFVCTKDNLDKIPEFLALAKNFGNVKVHLHNVLPHFKEMNNKDYWDYCLTIDDTHLIDKLKQDVNNDVVDKYPILVDRHNTPSFCHFPFNMIGVDGNGSYTICNSVYPASKKNGNIKDIDLWHNEYCNNFREQFYKNNLCDVCKKCFRNGEIF